MTEQPKDSTDFEIEFYEGILQKRGDFLQALIVLGDLYTRKGYYGKGLEIDRRLVALRPEDPYVLYNLACSYSLLQQMEKSLGAIKLAIECGYRDFSFLEADRDLTNLRRDNRFQQYFDQVRRERRNNLRKE